MARETIVLRGPRALTGDLVEHRGDGEVTIDVFGSRYSGPKLSAWRRRNADAPVPREVDPARYARRR